MANRHVPAIGLIVAALLMQLAVRPETPPDYDPAPYMTADRQGQHLCISAASEKPTEAKDMLPLVPRGPGKAPAQPPPDWALLGEFNGYLLIEAIIDKRGVPECASVLRTNLPKPVVEWLLSSFLKERFSMPTSKTGHNVPCYHYAVLGAGTNSGC
jgi:hypothetical protein